MYMVYPAGICRNTCFANQAARNGILLFSIEKTETSVRMTINYA